MSYKKHYLSDDKNYKRCPFNIDVACNSHCAWFDNEEQDCRKILALERINKNIFKGFDALWRKS